MIALRGPWSSKKVGTAHVDKLHGCVMAKAVVSFIVVFVLGFVLGGLFLMPYLPPKPARLVSALEADYWTTNWAGALVGLILGGLSARSVLRQQTRGASK